LHSSINDVNTIIRRVLNQIFHVTTETGQVRSDGRNTHNSAFSRCVTPWLVVGWEHTQVATSDELVVVQWQDWIVGVQELRVEDNLHTVTWVIEQPDSSDLVQDWVVGVVLHVVGDNWCNEEVQSVVQVEVVVAVEMALDEFVDLFFFQSVEVLEFMDGLELDNVQTIRQDPVWLSLQQVLRFVCGDQGNCGENIATVRGGSFNAVTVIDPSLTGFSVNIKVSQVVVEINTTSTEITT
ncbi:hypothetical protein WICPIJ_007198, partial [Wickerhamomyces pijperi]